MLPAPVGLSVHPVINMFPFNPPAWSLFYEMAVNVVFALICVFLIRRRLVLLLMVSFAALAAAAIINGELSRGWNYGTAWIGAARVTFSFFAGVAIHRIWQAELIKGSVPPWVSLLVLIAILIIPASGVWRATYDLFAIAVLFPLLLAVSLRTGASRTMSYLGRLSYPLYVLHVPVLVGTGLISTAFLGQPLSGFGLAGIAVTSVICIAVAAPLEPLDAKVRAWLTKRQQPPELATMPQTQSW